MYRCIHCDKEITWSDQNHKWYHSFNNSIENPSVYCYTTTYANVAEPYRYYHERPPNNAGTYDIYWGMKIWRWNHGKV